MPEAASSIREATFDIFRRWGYLQATLDPLGQFLPPEPFPTALPEGPEAEQAAAEARSFYCSTVGVEFMHIPSPEIRAWIQQSLEAPAPTADLLTANRVLNGLIRADLFEQVIQQRYLGTKRFSLEGLTVLIPFLDQLFSTSADLGVTHGLFAMAHRGRLNVMVNTVGRSSFEVFAKFEDVDPRSTMGGGDVKYHMGATGTFTTPNGKSVELHLASNPSHLEAVNPVIMGRTRAYQTRLGEVGIQQTLPIILHGDAAFAGQGITAESLNLATLDGYNLGGTIQVITNNLLGFTALPSESNSSRFASDLAKRLPIPIFHVNAEDPLAVTRIASLAAEFRATFHADVVIDLIGYRRHGHSEVDDPTVTQPRRYAAIKNHPPLYKIYADSIGIDATAEIEAVQNRFLADQKDATQAGHRPHMHSLPAYWSPFYGGHLRADDNPHTGIDSAEAEALTTALTTAPAGFHIHPKVEKLLAQRVERGHGKKPLDYGMAELRAYAPGVFRMSAAKAYSVQAGGERNDVVLNLDLRSLRTVGGHASSTNPSLTVASGSVTLTDTTDRSLTLRAAIDSEGNFTVQYVPPGNYTLAIYGATTQAERRFGREESAPLTPATSFQTFSQSLVVTDTDITDIAATLTPVQSK